MPNLITPHDPAEAVRRRIRRKWERRRAETGGTTSVTYMKSAGAFSSKPPGLVRPSPDQLEILLNSPRFARDRKAMIEKVQR